MIAALPWLLAYRQPSAAWPRGQQDSGTQLGRSLAIRLSWFRPTEITKRRAPRCPGRPVARRRRGRRSAGASGKCWSLAPRTATLTIRAGRPRHRALCRRQGRPLRDAQAGHLRTSSHPTDYQHRRTAGCGFATRCSRIRWSPTEPMSCSNLGRGYEPITWDIQLAQSQANGEPSRLDLKGNYSRSDIDPAGRHDLTLALEGSRWPWTLANSMIQVAWRADR